MNLIIERLNPTLDCGAKDDEELQKKCDFFKRSWSVKNFRICFWLGGRRCFCEAAADEYLRNRQGEKYGETS